MIYDQLLLKSIKIFSIVSVKNKEEQKKNAVKEVSGNSSYFSRDI